MMDMDKRAYLFRYIKDKGGWFFITLNNSEMTMKAQYFPLERWITVDKQEYKFSNVGYNEKEASKMIYGNGKMNHVTKPRVKMSGPEVYAVIKGNQTIVIIWKPDLLLNQMEIQCVGSSKRTKVDQDIKIDDLRSVIAVLLNTTLNVIEQCDSVMIYHNI